MLGFMTSGIGILQAYIRT